ncbi:MAG: hypothetical protein QOF72_228 [Blastocatellia bacterium]|jgi:hypothetical protein|nr:hypothetical protein [Blastocatellia bacterium]
MNHASVRYRIDSIKPGTGKGAVSSAYLTLLRDLTLLQSYFLTTPADDGTVLALKLGDCCDLF